MQASSVVLYAFLLAVLFMSQVSCATYRKPPFNGSIFGKRGNAVEYDNAGKALSAMCEIASEACSAWFPQPENN
ncbi:neuropeptide SIFamide [Anabrus simplex]|uniref:neuropeptide SIFamide n=1 Tax=Anabrus simplex TaxID=316456 RepID=UPI0035A2C534